MASHHHALLILILSSSGKCSNTLSNQCKRQFANYNQYLSPFLTFLFIAMALKCYSHNDNYDLEHIPTNDQKANCSTYSNITEDVCFKSYWIEADSDLSNIQVTRGCGVKDEMKRNGFWGKDRPECISKIDGNYKHAEGGEITACGCTTDYCNTSTFATPFHFRPLIGISFVKIYYIS